MARILHPPAPISIGAVGCKTAGNSYLSTSLRGFLRQKARHYYGNLRAKTLSAANSNNHNSNVLTREESEAEDQLDATQFMFHAQAGGKVNAYVQEQSTTYLVNIEANFGEDDDQAMSSPIHLHWGLFRSDSADWMLLEPQLAPSETQFVSEMEEAMETLLQKSSENTYTLQFEVPSEMAPFYISFALRSPSPKKNEKDLWIRRNDGLNFCIPVGLQVGRPDPLGITWCPDNSVNFSLYSRNATRVSLCLYGEDDTEPAMEVDLDPSVHKTGDIWHVQLDTSNFTRYGYRCKGDPSWDRGNRFNSRCILLDPYALALAPAVSGQEDLPSPATVLGWLKERIEFEWEDDIHPCIPLDQVTAYRLNVKGFTNLPSSGVPEEYRGTYLGLIEKIPYLKMLGVNAVILQPIFAFDISQGQFYPISYFSPTEAYTPDSDSSTASTSLKTMIKALHNDGIEVILDVVYSHTAENGDDDPQCISFRGIDNATYYVLDGKKRIMKSDTGSPNIFNCNHPAVHKMILDSLRYWVEEYHVDGFCFANAPLLIKGPHGQSLSRPLLLEAITFDPMLSKVKLVADAFSPITSVSKHVRFPHWKRWSESNVDFYTDVRRFFRGDKGLLSKFATRLCGSGEFTEKGRGFFNHVSNTYGLTLADGLSYSETIGAKTSHHYSWNCGEEGPSSNITIQETRTRQMRNLLVTMFLSQGAPLLNMGDEYGHSNGGIPCKDSCRNFDWGTLESNPELSHLISLLSSFRATHKDLLQVNQRGDIKWYGPQCEQPQWRSLESSFLAVSRQAGCSGLYVAFNAHEESIQVTIPEAPQETSWFLIGDTSLAHPSNFILNSASRPGKAYQMQPSSVLVLEARHNK